MTLMELKDRFAPRGIAEAGKDGRVWRTGTFEFIYETGPKAARLLDVLSDSPKGYSLVGEGVSEMESGGSRFMVQKFTVMKSARGEEGKIGDLEAQFDSANILVAVFLGASNRECPAIAKLVLREESG